MQVLLWQDIDKLGRRGDVVEVTDGYARNYLFPRGLATKPTPGMFKRFKQEKDRLERREKKIIENRKELAEQIEKTSLTIEAKANEEGHLYGSITPTIISEALLQQGLKVEAKLIELEEPIKEVGLYSIKINLHPQVQPMAKVWVVPTGDQTVEDREKRTESEG
jgi:large subunit ribosomal protein L9